MIKGRLGKNRPFSLARIRPAADLALAPPWLASRSREQGVGPT
jgi:hypothetical protein